MPYGNFEHGFIWDKNYNTNTWLPETFAKLRDAIDAKGITIEQAVDAINKIGVLAKSCWTCTHRVVDDGIDYLKICGHCNNFSNYEVK